VEPDLVERMKLGGLADGHFSYGPFFLDLPREPFSNERHLFSDIFLGSRSVTSAICSVTVSSIAVCPT